MGYWQGGVFKNAPPPPRKLSPSPPPLEGGGGGGKETGQREKTRLKSHHTTISASRFCFVNDTATAEIYPLSLHASLRICRPVLICAMVPLTPSPRSPLGSGG